ncbi:MAG: xanthine dehydrogenase family protein subunit M [Betaproteobacteria bacterium]|nr:xanthine dehydrogenase family protein subunit M [Betaproteobacteria bacterium]
MYALNYVKAKSVQEAAEFLAANPEAKLLAGGMTLLPTLKQRLARPTHLVDIAGLPELRRIEAKGGRLVVGAGMKHHEVATSAVVKKAIPALAGLAGEIGDPQVRNQGTIGGSVANNDPAADYPAAVLGLGATVVTTKREIAADDYFQGLFTTALGEGEIVVRVEFPLPKKAAYCKFHHPASGYAVAGVFIAQTAGGVRVAVTGAGPGVFRWSAAEAALAKGLKPAALESAKLDASGLNSDIHADREYRANLVRVMAKRALAKLSGKK